MAPLPGLKGKRVLLGVCAGVAAYKAVEVLRLLTKAGARVDVIMTPSARRFVGEQTFRSLSGRGAIVDLFEPPADFPHQAAAMPHLEIAEQVDLALVVPATANTLAKMALGIADNALLTTLLSVTAPVVVAPAMDSDMWRHPATQANVETLRARGVHFVGPVEGALARGNVGPGRLAEPEVIVAEAAALLSAGRLLEGKCCLITAGGTREPLDPVRYVGNRSSGKMGYALAQAARALGARVQLVTGPVSLPAPAGVEVARVQTAEEMKEEVLRRLPGVDAVVMAAAVADYRPAFAEPAKHKKRGDEAEEWRVTLVRNPDIAALVGERKRPDQVLVIFAAETEELLERAREKLAKKRADMAVANDVTQPGSGFDADTNQVTLLFADGRRVDLPLMSKGEVGMRVMRYVAELLDERS